MILTIIAIFGLVITALATTASFSSSSTFVNTGDLGSGVGYVLTLLVGAFGTILALIGGLIAKPKYLWIGFIVTGIIYLISFYGYFVPSSRGYLIGFSLKALAGILVMLLPGLACIGTGIFLRRFHRRVRNQLS